MPRLAHHLLESNEPDWTLNDIDDTLDALEHFIDDDDETLTISEEGLMSDFFKNQTDDWGDQLETLFKGSKGVTEAVGKRIDALTRSARELKRGQAFKPKFSGIAPYLYDANRERYRFDLERAFSEDIKWINQTLIVIEALDQAIEKNIDLLDNAPIAKGKRAFESYWVDRSNAKVASAASVWDQANHTTFGLYASKLEMAKGYNPDLRGEDRVKQAKPMILTYGKPKVGDFAKRELEKEHELTQNEIIGYLRQCGELVDVSQTLYEKIQTFKKKYHPEKGPIYQFYNSFEQKALEQMEYTVVNNGLKVVGQGNLSLLKSVKGVPMKLMTRNLKLLRVMIRFSDQFF